MKGTPRMTQEPELKPCPFCGGEAEIWRSSPDGKRRAWISCMGRCAVLITSEHITDAEAVAAWNTRHPASTGMEK